MHLVGIPLQVDERKIVPTQFVGPHDTQSLAHLAVLHQFVVGTLVEVIRERLGLDGGHEGDVIADGLIVIALTRAGQGSDEAAFREFFERIGHDFGDAHAIELKPKDVPAAEDP